MTDSEPGPSPSPELQTILAALNAAVVALDGASAAVVAVRAGLADAIDQLTVAASATRGEFSRQESERLRMLQLAMKPGVPDLVGDHVPPEWTGEGKSEP